MNKEVVVVRNEEDLDLNALLVICESSWSVRCLAEMEAFHRRMAP